jgi:hypothetical protein
VTGRHKEALRQQEAISRAWWDGFEVPSVSFPLAEWLRLSGACQDEEAFARAVEFCDEVQRYARIPGDGPAYLRLARAKGAIALGLANGDIDESLSSLLTGRVPNHVRASAFRWLVRLCRQLGLVERQASLRETLQALKGHDARTQAALIDLDEASAGDALDRLRETSPGVTRHLLEAAKSTSEEPVPFVARFFPY